MDAGVVAEIYHGFLHVLRDAHRAAANLDAWILHLELGDRRGKHGLANGETGKDVDNPGPQRGLVAWHGVEEQRFRLNHPQCSRQHRLAISRQQNLFALRLHQGDVQRLLQAADMLVHGRLAEAQDSGRAGVALLARDFDEASQKLGVQVSS
ncbi:hypothetical protein D3C87_1586030 [compost metagenome]